MDADENGVRPFKLKDPDMRKSITITSRGKRI